MDSEKYLESERYQENVDDLWVEYGNTIHGLRDQLYDNLSGDVETRRYGYIFGPHNLGGMYFHRVRDISIEEPSVILGDEQAGLRVTLSSSKEKFLESELFSLWQDERFGEDEVREVFYQQYGLRLRQGKKGKNVHVTLRIPLIQNDWFLKLLSQEL